MDHTTDLLGTHTIPRAMAKASDFLGDMLLPSPFGIGGNGWQELLTSTYAGFYASCNGLEIISSQADGTYKLDRPIAAQVIDKHLVRYFDDTSNHPPELFTRMTETTCQVAKVAEFVAVMLRLQVDRPIVSQLLQQLVDTMDPKGGWPPIFGGTQPAPALAVSAQVIAALSLTRVHQDIWVPTTTHWIATSLSEFEKNPQKIHSQPDDLIFLLWSQCLLIEHDIEDDPLRAEQVLRLMWKLISNHQLQVQRPIGSTYEVPAIGRNDYYMFNSSLILSQSLLILSKHLPEVDFLYGTKLLYPIIAEITGQFLRNGFYQVASGGQFYFWVNYQAFTLMRDYYVSLLPHIKNNSHQLEPSMIVTPTLFRNTTVPPQNDLCVVIMPFKTAWSNHMYKSLSKILKKNRVKSWRSDDEFSDDIIVQTVWEKLNACRFVIADCTDQNANVFYELGICHTLGKKVFMCSQNRDDFVFDIANIRSYTYKYTPEGLEALESSLDQFIKNNNLSP